MPYQPFGIQREDTMKLPAAIILIATAVLLPAYGSAETVPDMKGTWVTTSTLDSVV